MATIQYAGINNTVTTNGSAMSLLDVSIENQIPHIHECGGNGRCTTCRVRVLGGMQNLSPPTQQERDIARARKWDPTIRLACQCYVKGDAQIQRLIWSNSEIAMLQKETVPEGIGEERPIVILTCDMRNFTSLTSENFNFDMVHLLNRFFTTLGDPILMNNGIIYQYVGDEIVALFGTSGGTRAQNSIDAIRAGLGMLYALERLNQIELKDFDTTFQIGIGIHFGEAYLGHVGHPKFRQFTVIGDPINVAKRIEEKTKTTEENLLISENVYNNLPPDLVEYKNRYKVQLKGKEGLFKLYGVVGFQQTDVHLELQATLNLLLKNEEAFAKRFYDHVFEAAPSVRSLFKTNMEGQRRLLTHMLAGIVYSLSRPEHLEMGLKALGKSHAKYGVQAAHYPVVKKILIQTIEEELGVHYTPRVAEAWDTAIGMVVGKMEMAMAEKV